MPRKSKSKKSLRNKSPTEAKSMVQLEKENEIIYNKKHIWMKRVFTDFLKNRFPKHRAPKTLYPSLCLKIAKENEISRLYYGDFGKQKKRGFWDFLDTFITLKETFLGHFSGFFFQ